MPAREMPAAEVDVDASLVRALLADQHADLADLPLTPLASGWDNVIFRLGRDVTVRLPRRAIAAELVEHEQRWLPQLAPRLPLPIPAPLRVGEPALGYPWPWSVTPWLPGEVAASAPVLDLRRAAQDLGDFLRALHRPAAADAPRNPFRGGPLTDRTPHVRARAEQLVDLVDAPAVLACWNELVTTPAWEGAPVWLHGDLHPANLLVEDGRLCAVIDFGDITAGDPATDLSVAWSLLDGPNRDALRVAAGDIDDHTWARARGWALHLALAYLSSSADNATMHRIGKQTLEAALAG